MQRTKQKWQTTRNFLSILSCILCAGFFLSILLCIAAMKDLNKDLAQWAVRTKMKALTEIVTGQYDIPTYDIKAVPQVNLDELEYDQYSAAKEALEAHVESAKSYANQALADFRARTQSYNIVQDLHQYAAQGRENVALPNRLVDFTLYLKRWKAATQTEYRLSALKQQTGDMMHASMDVYWATLDAYVHTAFAVNDILAEMGERQAAHEAELETARRLEAEKQWAGVPANAVGRLRIPQYNISIPLYSGMAQGIVDANNSAATYPLNGVSVIADHWNQNGFSAIRNMAVGTRVYIDNPDGSTAQHTVTWCGRGYNMSTALLFSDNSPVDNRYGGLLLYTCMNDWQNIAIVCCG